MDKACSTLGAKRNSYCFLVGELVGERPLGRPRCRWVDNIKMDPIEIRLDDMDWIHLRLDRVYVVGCCEHGNEPLGSIKY
jgi:hypothetical protein